MLIGAITMSVIAACVTAGVVLVRTSAISQFERFLMIGTVWLMPITFWFVLWGKQ